MFKYKKLKDNFGKLTNEYIQVKAEKEYYERLCEAKNKTISNLQNEHSELNKSMNNLITENKKLIDWITKILDTFGTMDVRERKSVKIPVYKNVEWNKYNIHYLGNYEERLEIPAITIVKMRLKERM